MKKTKRILVTLTSFMIVCMIFASSVKADEEFNFYPRIGRIVEGNSINTPYETATPLSVGQTYKYDQFTNMVVFSTEYMNTNNFASETRCSTNNDWDNSTRKGVATRVGIARIIREFNMDNNITPDNATTEILQKNLRATLAINQFLYDHIEKNEKYLVNGVEPKTYLPQRVKEILDKADNDYNIIVNSSVQMTRHDSNFADYFNPMNTENAYRVYHIIKKDIEIDNFQILVSNTSELPEGISFKVYKSLNENDFSYVDTIDTTKNEISVTFDTENQNGYYLKIEMFDERSDKSIAANANIKTTVTGIIDSQLAVNYTCENGSPSVTPNATKNLKIKRTLDSNMKVNITTIPQIPSLKVVTKEKDSNKKFKNVKIFVLKIDGDNTTNIKEGLTNEVGELDGVEDLELTSGTYCIVEETPEGYKLDSKDYCFNVSISTEGLNNHIAFSTENTSIEYKKNNGIIQVNLENVKDDHDYASIISNDSKNPAKTTENNKTNNNTEQVTDVPNTLSAKSIIIIISGILLLGAGVGLYIYGFKKKKNN